MALRALSRTWIDEQAMKISVLVIGRVRGPLEPAVREFEARAAHYWKLEVVEIESGTGRGAAGDARSVRSAEGRRLLGRVPQGLETWALTREGARTTSKAFANALGAKALEASPGVTFLVGGAYGLDPEVLGSSTRQLSPSGMTLSHEFARLLLAEQVIQGGYDSEKRAIPQRPIVNPSTTGDRIDESPWYRRWFGEEYLQLYPHRDEAEANEGVRLLVDCCQLDAGDPVLDLACGAGRHLRALRRRGMRPFGLDLSVSLLRRAKRTDPEEALLRADMRVLPFAADSFSAVTSFFTSFGYFQSEEDDGRVLWEIRRVLGDGGHLLLDFLNAQQVRDTLSPRDEGEVNGRRVIQERRLVDGGRAVEKTIRIGGEGGRDAEVFHERVRLYSAGELSDLLVRCRLDPQQWFGDYAAGPPTESSPRLIALARAS